ncbi:putative Ig domain-containing protein [Actinocrinis puniceicyclus]|uniref:Putative Ig domain-containing protein n=1 Tax=Actinocrinis puniceicyclus TaxID=977794 RepID=A0A8J7WWN9_9ACTN|nr:Ig domain-containing protein [Actinocrinis puniceicyclus]MBS2966469.1 putative Ig domain-containing protein [Actinocrinis puniceicyclus]
MPSIANRPAALLLAAVAVAATAAVGGATFQHPGEPDHEEHEAVVFQPDSSTGSCGVERWSVKTGTDADRALINLQSTTTTTIAALSALSAPSTLPANNRVQPTETTVFRLPATLTEFKLEADSDYHLVLTDGSGHTMIAEIPDPACVGSTSPLASSITKARGEFDAKYTPTTSFKTANIPVTVTGVGFFDFLHGQTGVAPNGIELHAVLDIQFGSGSAGGVTVTNPGNQTGTVGTAASLQIHASDTAGGTLSYSATGLPAGLSVNTSTGQISGTPTTAGTSGVTVTATDSTGASAAASFTWTINPSSGGCAAAQLLGNPGFETGTAAPWSSSSGVINSSSSEPPHSGTYDAWMDGYGSTHTDTLSQSVTLPSGCASYTLGFYLHVDTAETTTTTAYDTLKIQLLNSSGSVLTTLATYSNLAHGTGYAQHTFNLSAYAGQSVTVKFTGSEDSSYQTSFVIDDTSLNVG